MIQVFGDRQEGKTHLLLGFAASEALSGKSVVFECRDWNVAADAQRRLIDSHLSASFMSRVSMSHGNRKVRTNTGGCVMFVSGRCGGSARGVNADVHIFDEATPDDRVIPGARVYYAPIADDSR